jgi:hypothetical protein
MNPEMQESVTRLRALGERAMEFGAPTPYVVIQPKASGYPARWSAEDPETLYKGIRCIAQRMRLDPARWHLGGFSLGAYVAAHIACAHPESFASYGLIAGGADILAACIRDLGPTLYVHGVEDDIIPFVMAERLAHVARRSTVPDGRIEVVSGVRTRYVAPHLWVETIFHNGLSPVAGSHCVPGGSGPIGCLAGIDTGMELLQFYINHIQR